MAFWMIERSQSSTYGGVSNPIIIICARALKKDHPHWVNGRASTSPAIASQLSGGKP